MLIAIRIDVVVVFIDRVDEMLSFIHFVGMPIAPCFKARGYYHAHKFPASNSVSSQYLTDEIGVRPSREPECPEVEFFRSFFVHFS